MKLTEYGKSVVGAVFALPFLSLSVYYGIDFLPLLVNGVMGMILAALLLSGLTHDHPHEKTNAAKYAVACIFILPVCLFAMFNKMWDEMFE